MSRIGVVGLGYVGLAHAVAFALYGFEVVGVDVDDRRLESIEKGDVHGVPRDAVERALGGGLRVSGDYGELRDVDLVFLAVGTPTNPDGFQDLSQVLSALRSLAEVWRGAGGGRVVVVKSTVLPGTTRRLAALAKELGLDVGFVHNPEFLVGDRALEGVLRPSRVVVGGVDERSAAVAAGFFREFYRRVGAKPPIVVVSAEEAELIKYASNVFLALKTVFGNLIGVVCEQLENCDAWRVLEAVGLDPRIGRSHLLPGMPYGGPCLVKDVHAFSRFVLERTGVDFFYSIHKYNEWLRDRVIDVLRERLGGLRGRRVAVFGIAYKVGSPEVKDSQSLTLAKRLLEEGAEVWVHDVETSASRSAAAMGVKTLASPEEACGMDAVVVTLGYDVYRSIPCNGPLVVDVVNITEGSRSVRLYTSRGRLA